MRIPSRFTRNGKAHLTARRIKDPVPNARVDVWISRLASISQFGLFVLTIGGFYFTVLPLYQKAVLEEAIAKKEVELKGITVALEKSYRQVRDSTVKDYVFGVGTKCSGLMLPLRTTSLLRGEIRKPYAQEILEIDPKKCLVEVQKNNTELLNLYPEDMKMLQDAIDAIALELDKKRSDFILQSSQSWNSKQADVNANKYADLVRSRVSTLRKLSWNR